ncbi:MAG: phosphatidate cytidylyltransferase [Thermaerobacter sp.]|nr:phosphatidate cytidylyltransferase [Thermaerobacter sp.]
MLSLRIFTASIGLPIVLVLVYWGGWTFTIGFALLAAAGALELSQMLMSRGILFFPRIAVVWIVALFISRQVPGVAPTEVLALGMALNAVAGVILGRDASSFMGVVTTSWAALYLGYLFSFLVALRHLQDGLAATVSFFVVVWITDTLAFFVGRRFGRTRLLPHVSPSKTWAGTLGGAAGAVAGGICLSWFLHVTWWQGGLFGLVVSGTGQLGDLLESQLKRFTGVKDSGGLLPGHGGILDRFDSVLFALPFAYYLLKSLGIP